MEPSLSRGRSRTLRPHISMSELDRTDPPSRIKARSRESDPACAAAGVTALDKAGSTVAVRRGRGVMIGVIAAATSLALPLPFPFGDAGGEANTPFSLL